MSEKSIRVPRPDCLRNLLKWNNFPLIGRHSVYEKCSILFSSVNHRRNSFWLPHNQCSGLKYLFIELLSKVLVFTHQQKVIKAFNRYCFTIYETKLQYINLIGKKRCQCPKHRKNEILVKSAVLLPLHYFLFHFTNCSLL